MRSSSLFAALVLSLELAPAASMRIPMPLESPSPMLASTKPGPGFDNAQRDLDGHRHGYAKEKEMEMDKRRESKEDDTDPSGDERGRDRGRRPSKGDDGGRDEIRETSVGADADGRSRANGNAKKEKQKHVPGEHHRDDRLSTSALNETGDERKGGSRRPHGHARHPRLEKGKGKRYLSSNPRYHPKRYLSVWDYDRHTKRMGESDPLHGTGLREEKRNSGRHGHDILASTFAEEGNARGDSLPLPKDRTGSLRPVGLGGDMVGHSHLDKPKGVPSHRQGVTLGDGSTIGSAHSLASTSTSKVPHTQGHPSARGLLEPLSVDGLLGMEYEAYDCEDDIPSHSPPHTFLRRDGEGGDQGGEPAPPEPPAVVSVLDGGSRMYAEKIIWQPTSAHPEKEWGGGGLQKRRKNKNKDKDRHGRHGDDDEDEDDYGDGDEDSGGRRKGKDKHRGDDEEDDEYGASSTSGRKKGKGRYDDDDEYGPGDGDGEYDEPRSRPKSGSKAGKHGGYQGEDEDEDSYDPPSHFSSSKFDDGQYHPSAYSNIDDCATLSSFYTSMKGETWTPVVDWSASVQRRAPSSSLKGRCCTWTGVTCDEYHRVIGLSLPNQGLTGPLSEDLFSLDALLRL